MDNRDHEDMRGSEQEQEHEQDQEHELEDQEHELENENELEEGAQGATIDDMVLYLAHTVQHSRSIGPVISAHLADLGMTTKETGSAKRYAWPGPEPFVISVKEILVKIARAKPQAIRDVYAAAKAAKAAEEAAKAAEKAAKAAGKAPRGRRRRRLGNRRASGEDDNDD